MKLVNKEQKTTSYIIAEKFGKEHKNVLRDIRTITEAQPEFARLNFELCFRINELANNRKVEYYELTEQGFAILAMGFTGVKALEWKVEFLAEFERIKKEHVKTMEMMYEVITSKAFLGQEHGLKLAGIQHPRKFMQFFKESLVGIDWLIEHGYFSHRQVGANSTDRCWCWTKSGLDWLLENNTKLNKRVKALMAA